MRAFKKKTIALVLASVVTVVGAFGADNYKNSLMDLVFKPTSEGVEMIVQTRSAYEGDIALVRRDANTYMLMMPETGSQSIVPKLGKVSGNISSVDVQTLPYSANSKGYTKITIKTYPNTTLTAKKEIFVPGNSYRYLQSESSDADRRTQLELEKKILDERARLVSQQAEQEALKRQAELRAKEELEAKRASEEAKKKAELLKKKQQEAMLLAQKAKADIEVENVVKSSSEPIQNNVVENVNVEEYHSTSSSNNYLWLLSGICILGLIAYFLVRARDKMNELAGEKIDINTDEEEKNKKQPVAEKKEKNKKKTKPSKKIESKDSKKSSSPVTTQSRADKDPVANIETTVSEPQVIETVNVVDLDEIFKEQTKTTSQSLIDEEENAALEDFLSGFSFDEEFFEAERQEPDPGYDVEFYEKVLSNDSCKFSKDDIEKISKLLSTEINDSTLKNIEKYAVSNPISKKVSKKQILEEFVTTYAIEQSITFSKEDVSALYKLLNVEIDSDFITDLRTDPQRMQEMQQEMLSKKERVHKPSEILTLNVKDVLPDLSEALRKQGGREIKSEVKPQTVYFSEGYDVGTLSLNDQLPDLTTALGNKESYISKPSADYELVDTSYDVKKLKISSQLPDLTDMLKNPDKYSKPPLEPVTIDQDALLNNISNVQFKPFYDGEPIEVLNQMEDFEQTTVVDIQKELNQFGDVEISHDEICDTPSEDTEQDDFAELFDNKYVDLDAEKSKSEFSENYGMEESKIDEIVLADSILNEMLAQGKVEESVSDGIYEQSFNVVEGSQVEEQFAETSLLTAEENENDNANVEQSILEPKAEVSIEAKFTQKMRQSSEELLKKIQTSKERRENRILSERSAVRTPFVQREKNDSSKIIADIKCIFEGETYTVISTAHFIGRAGCYLAKNEKGYIVLGHYGDKLVSLRQYETLKSEKIQTRMSEKLPNDTNRFLVRIGIHKFVVDVVNGEEIKYVTDLC